jgi:zinc protease
MPTSAFHRRAARYGVIALLAAAFMSVMAPSAGATKIEQTVSPGGIEIWLVRDATVPLIAMEFAFRGGATQDPPDKAGVSNMTLDLLDEGAGELDARAFHEALERKAIEMNFQPGREYVRGTLRTLKENKEEAFNLLRLALTAPRFEASAVERIRAQIMSRLQRATTTPNDIASRTWWQTAFPGHPYSRQVIGSLESVPHITADDLRNYVRHIFARDTLKVAIVGDIDAATAGQLVDRTFGSLPAKSQRMPVPTANPQGLGRRIVIDLDVPQSSVTFGGPGVARGNPDFMTAYIVNHILGGGSFSSRLFQEVREKRGLAYGIFDTLLWFDHAAVLIGGTAVRADATAEAISVIEDQVRLMAKDGPTEQEIAKAKTYLKGSFALALDTSTKIASQLITMQLDNLGVDYIDRRSALIDAVTVADAKRVAKRMLEGGFLYTVVGRPKGLTSSN